MSSRPRRTFPAARAAWAPLLALALALAAVLGATPAGFAQEPATKPAPSPSEPPFWARPRPQQAAPAECVCDDTTATTTPAPSRRPALLGGLLGIVAAALGVLLWWRRRARPTERPVSPAARPAPVEAAPARGESARAVQSPVTDGLDPRVRSRAPVAAAPKPPEHDDLALADPRTARIELAEAEPEAESAGAQAFYTEIANSLTAALRREPDRQDLRRKLLEIHFSGRQTTEFVTLAHEYLDRNQGVRDQFWGEIGAMGATLAPEHELFREWTSEGRRARTATRRTVHTRRFHERSVDQGKLYIAQQGLVTDFQRLRADPAFQTALSQLLADSVRRPAPLTASPELAYVADGAQIYIKHEDRRRFHDDVMMNAIGQILVAQRLGRSRVVTATRDGIHGHAVAGAAARLGMECTVYIAERDLNRYYARVLSMRRLGAHIRPIPGGADADPRRAAMDAWLDEPARMQYISGLTAGPQPFAEMVREFLSVVGRETAAQMQQSAGGPPAAVVAGVCDGHLGLGLLQGFLDQHTVQLYCVEERPQPAPAEAPAADASLPEPPVAGQLTRREHRWLRESKRVQYVTGEDHETLRIIEQFHSTGTTLFTESARTMAFARSLARRRERREAVVVLMTNQEGADFRAHRHDW